MDRGTMGLNWGHKTCPWSLPFVSFVGSLEVIFVAAFEIELWEGRLRVGFELGV